MPLGASVSRRLIAQGAVQSLGVIGLSPLLDQQARLAQKRMSVPQRLRRSQRFAPIEPATPL